ncbi:MAG TPA: glycosyltransferase family A protein [Steroidobacteraceae bacterium]|nr:glycosyltransferase family A protein [Steroidobacteraceae bacterium]
MSPLVSIIVPTFNRLTYLRKSLASVFAQTFRDWELLIADDGSGIDTRTYLQSLQDPVRVRVLWLPHTGRPAVARNAALRAAKGEYVAFLDSDDLWTPTKLQKQMDSLRSRSNRRWGYTRFVLVDGSGNPTAWQCARSWPVPEGWIFDKLVRSETVIAVPSVVASRELLQQVGGFDESLVMCEDYDLWLRLAAQSEVDVIDEPCTLVTRHAEHSGSELISFEDCARVFAKVRKTRGTEHLHAILNEKSAEVAIGLARSQVACGDRLSGLRTLIASAPQSWRYRRWWLGTLITTARALAPQPVLQMLRSRRPASAGRARGVPQP